MILDKEHLSAIFSKLTQRQIVYAETFARTDDVKLSRQMAGMLNGDDSHLAIECREYMLHIKATAMHELGMSTKLIARELGVIAFAKPSDFFDSDPDLGLLTLKNLDDMPAQSAIKKIKFGKFNEVAEIEFYDKLAALKMLGEHIGMWKERRELAPEPIVEKAEPTVKNIIQIGHRRKGEEMKRIKNK